MKIIDTILTAAVILATSISAEAQQTRVLTADKHNEYGLVYTLPITTMRVDITARHTIYRAGEYNLYAKRYIGTNDPITADSEKWEITGVQITPYGIPNPEKQYLMQLKSGALTYISVSTDGMLLAINKEVSAPSIAPAPKDPKPEAKPTGKEYLEYVGDEFTVAQSASKRVQLLAEALSEIREAKMSLTRGTADTMPTDGRQLEIMLNSLTDQERAITRAFCGYEWSETVTRSYTFTPEEDGTSTLMRMSDFAGFVAADDYSGDPVNVNVEIISEGTLPVDQAGIEKKYPKDGVAYAIPGTARITLTHKGTTLASTEMEIAQFGTVFGLAPSLFTTKKEASYATFNPITGAIETIGTIQSE